MVLQLSRDVHYSLERLLKKAIQENRQCAARYPTVADKLNQEAANYEIVLNQLLMTPLLSAPRPTHNANDRIPQYARPKIRVA